MSKSASTPKSIQKAQKHATRNERHQASATLRAMSWNASNDLKSLGDFSVEVDAMRTKVRHYKDH